MNWKDVSAAMASRDVEMLVKAAEEYAAEFPEPLRIELIIAFVKGGTIGARLRSESDQEIVNDVFREHGHV